MTGPNKRLRGIADLGSAVDERIRAGHGELDLRHDTGAPTDSTVSGGATAGGGGGFGSPAFPENHVESLRLTDGGTERSGDIVIDHAGVGAIAEDTAPGGDRRFTWQGRSVESVASLPGSPDAETIYLRTSDSTLWWHDGTSWLQLATGGSGYWSRASAVLSPATANDQLDMSGNLAGSPLAFAGNSSSAPLSTGLKGAATAATSNPTFGVEGSTGSTSNEAYGGSFDKTRLGSHADTEDQGSDPSAPPSGYGRWFSGVTPDKRAYLKDDDGVVHDLSVQHRQVFWAAGDDHGGVNDINLHWADESVIAEGTPSTVTSATRCTFSTAQDTGSGRLSDSYARLSWTPRTGGGEVQDQAKVMAGAPCRRFGGTATVRARLRLNSAGSSSAFAGLYLVLSDSGSNQSVSSNLITTLSANTWAEVVLTGVDVSGWSDFLRLTVTAAGTTVEADAGQCIVDIEYLAIEQWAA